MRTSSTLLALGILSFTSGLSAGTVLTWREDGLRNGKPYHSEYTASVSEIGIRIDLLETTDSTRRMSFVYLKQEGVVHFALPDTKQRITINKAVIDTLRTKLREAGKSDTLFVPTVTPLHTRHSINGFACEGYSYRLPGRSRRFACMADPASIGVSPEVQQSFRAFGELLTPFFTFLTRLSPESDPSEREAVDVYALPGGFPVHDWEPRPDGMALDLQLLSVRQGDTPSTLFVLPAE